MGNCIRRTNAFQAQCATWYAVDMDEAALDHGADMTDDEGRKRLHVLTAGNASEHQKRSEPVHDDRGFWISDGGEC